MYEIKPKGIEIMNKSTFTVLTMNALSSIRDNLLDFETSLEPSMGYLNRISKVFDKEPALLDHYFRMKYGSDYMDTVRMLWTKRMDAYESESVKHNILFGFMYADVVHSRVKGHNICSVDFAKCAAPSISSEEMLNILNSVCDEYYYSYHDKFDVNVLIPCLVRLFRFYHYNGATDSDMFRIENAFLCNRKDEIHARDFLCKQALRFQETNCMLSNETEDAVVHKCSMAIGKLFNNYELFCLGRRDYSIDSYIMRICTPRDKQHMFECSEDEQQKYIDLLAPLGAEVLFEKSESSGLMELHLVFQNFDRLICMQ